MQDLAFLEKKRELNKQYRESVKNDPIKLEKQLS